MGIKKLQEFEMQTQYSEDISKEQIAANKAFLSRIPKCSVTKEQALDWLEKIRSEYKVGSIAELEEFRHDLEIDMSNKIGLYLQIVY